MGFDETSDIKDYCSHHYSLYHGQKVFAIDQSAELLAYDSDTWFKERIQDICEPLISTVMMAILSTGIHL